MDLWELVARERVRDTLARYRDTLVPVGDEWLIQHRLVSTDWRSPGSTMAPRSSIS